RVRQERCRTQRTETQFAEGRSQLRRDLRMAGGPRVEALFSQEGEGAVERVEDIRGYRGGRRVPVSPFSLVTIPCEQVEVPSIDRFRIHRLPEGLGHRDGGDARGGGQALLRRAKGGIDPELPERQGDAPQR